MMEFILTQLVDRRSRSRTRGRGRRRGRTTTTKPSVSPPPSSRRQPSGTQVEKPFFLNEEKKEFYSAFIRKPIFRVTDRSKAGNKTVYNSSQTETTAACRPTSRRGRIVLLHSMDKLSCRVHGCLLIKCFDRY